MATATESRPTPRLQTQYTEQIPAKLSEEFGLSNPMSLPRLEKVVLNVNMGRHLDGTKIPANIKSTILKTLTTVSGQKPVVIKAKRSVANFKVREGYETAAKVTIRRERMWDFLDRFINLCTPRIKDFRGLPAKGFDRAGNYSVGLTEQSVFPEIDMGNENFIHGMHINFVFANSDPEKSRFVLEQLGMPFERPEDN
ncbi:MAG: 50S ribosomal protein L5 [Planctomycetota bacterium]|jgi:large subunit ribosomal protein L5